MVTRLIPGVHPNGVALTLLTSVYLAYIEHGNLVPVLARRQLNMIDYCKVLLTFF